MEKIWRLNYLLFILLSELYGLKCSENLLKEAEAANSRERYSTDLDFQCQSLQEARACNITRVLSSLLEGYDKRLRPFEGDDIPVEIRVGISIINLDKINEVNMDYRLDLYLVQRWVDPRLSSSSPEDLLVPNSIAKKIWIPDTYFLNSKHARYHKVTVPNSLLVLKPDGSLIYSSRITVRASCPMDFRLYPVDTQECHLHIESFGYTANEIIYHWNSSRKWSVPLSDQVRQLPQFHIAEFKRAQNITLYPLGNWSTLKATFIIQRHLGYFFLHLYSPCAMVVVLSWVSFFIPKEGIGARIKLSIIATLTITTILNMLNKVLPQVSYIKMVDWYLIISFVFVFGVFVEYTTVLWLTEKEMQRVAEREKREKIKQDKMNTNINESTASTSKGLDSSRSSRKRDISFTIKNSDRSGDPSILEETDNMLYEENKVEEMLDDEDKESQSLANTHEVYFMCHFRIAVIDEFARVLFPLAYIAFNIVYWLFFFNNKQRPQTID